MGSSCDSLKEIIIKFASESILRLVVLRIPEDVPKTRLQKAINSSPELPVSCSEFSSQ